METTEGVETADMRIRVIGGQHDRRWRYRDFWLDQETKKSVELGQVEQDRYLFVHTYSGGASCCWSLLVFDLTKGKALGELLKGYSGIDMEKGSGNCPVAAVTVPELPEYSATNAGKPFKYCFDGVRFSRRRSMPSVRIQTND